VSSKEFVFTLRSPALVSPTLIRDLVARICAVTSCASDGDLARLVEEAVTQAAAQGPDEPCELCFKAHAGALGVSVQAGSRQILQTSRPIH
jgi:hypothetical protein